MEPPKKCVIGIDVGGPRKGFHAVAIRGGHFVPKRFQEAAVVAEWCREQDAHIIAIDAPCAWSVSGGSRLAERSLAIAGVAIQCFKTPTRASAVGRAFYDWVFQGERLYQLLIPEYHLFDGTRRNGKQVFETFPHAVACALEGRVLPAHPKTTTRRRILRDAGYDDGPLTNIDFVDAALCAVTADRFLHGHTRAWGDQAEGYILAPT